VPLVGAPRRSLPTTAAVTGRTLARTNRRRGRPVGVPEINRDEGVIWSVSNRFPKIQRNREETVTSLQWQSTLGLWPSPKAPATCRQISAVFFM
jgi:hypothetical protein